MSSVIWVASVWCSEISEFDRRKRHVAQHGEKHHPPETSFFASSSRFFASPRDGEEPHRWCRSFQRLLPGVFPVPFFAGGPFKNHLSFRPFGCFVGSKLAGPPGPPSTAGAPPVRVLTRSPLSTRPGIWPSVEATASKSSSTSVSLGRSIFGASKRTSVFLGCTKRKVDTQSH